MRTMRPLIVALCASILAILAVPTIGADALPPGGPIVSQSKDTVLNVTETHLVNGLTILTREDHAAPVAYFGVFYKVGSRNETTGETGLSHILEHMMFKGTKDLPPGSIARLFQRNGGEINAETDIDHTYYHELIASDRLELAVRVEADRMENSLFDPTELNHEMSVVRSELEGDSNDPGRQLHDFTFLPLTFLAHPYHWPTIGWRADVENAAKHRDVIYDYYKEHYMPNNAVVVVVGDFDTAKLVAMCQKYFGVYSAGKLETHYITPEPPQHGERRGVLRRPGSAGQVLIGWHAAPLGTQDHYTMDVISMILSAGQSSRLYQDLVQQGIAESADASNYDTVDPYVFTVSGEAHEGVTTATLETALEAEVDKLKTDPVSPEELRRAKNEIEASFTFQNDSVSDQAEQIGFYSMTGDYKYLETYIPKIKAVTAAQVQDVAKRYFGQDQRTVAIFDPLPLPPGAEPPPPAQTSEHFGVITTRATPQQAKMVAALDAKFNKNVVAPKKRTLPVRRVLPNGLVVLVQENHANKTVAMMGSLRAGDIFDPTDKPDLAEVTAAMLSRGAAGKTSLQIANSLEFVGTSVNVSANTEGIEFSGNTLTKNFGLMISTLSDELRRPDFPPDELERLRGESLSALEDEKQDAGGTGGAGTPATIAFMQSIYPPHHPYWEASLSDQQASIKAMTRDDLAGFYQKYYRPDTMILVIVGDVNTDDAIAEVSKYFGDWQKPSSPVPQLDIPDVPLPAKAPATQVVTLPDTAQTSILLGTTSPIRRSDPDFYGVEVMNYILGGSVFGSHLGDAIRDERGLAYSVYSNFDADHGAGPFTVFLGTNPTNATKATDLARLVMQNFRDNGVNQTEVNEAVDYLTGSFALTLETNTGLAEVIDAEEEFGLGLDYVNRRSDIYHKVTVAQVDALAKKLIHPDKLSLVIAGAPPD